MAKLVWVGFNIVDGMMFWFNKLRQMSSIPTHVLATIM